MGAKSSRFFSSYFFLQFFHPNGLSPANVDSYLPRSDLRIHERGILRARNSSFETGGNFGGIMGNRPDGHPFRAWRGAGFSGRYFFDISRD